jgi:hypothetical protein
MKESLFESNFRPVPIEVNSKRVTTAPPENFEQLTFLEKLMYTGKNSPAKAPKSPTRRKSIIRNFCVVGYIFGVSICSCV